MASPLDFLRLRNIFGNNPNIMMDDPSQGGLAGNMRNPIGLDPSSFGTGDENSNELIGFPQNVMPAVDFRVNRNSMPGNSTDDLDIGGMMSKLYSPRYEATDRFNDLAQMYPEREKPSILRRIGSALTAFGPGGTEAGMEVMNRPFNEKFFDWKQQIGPAAQGAQMERGENVNERTMAYQTIAQELRNKAQEAKERNDERNATIREHRASVYEFKAMHPGMKFNFSGPTVMVSDPITGQVTDTKIPTGSMSTLDKLHLQGEQAIAQIHERGTEARKTEDVREINKQKDIEARGEQARRTKATPSGNAPGGKGELPTQTRVRQYTAANELKNSDPELSKFIKLGPGANDFSITPPGTNVFGSKTGPTPEQHKRITEKIYGTAPAINQPTRTGVMPTSSSAPAKTGTEEERVTVIDLATGKAVATIPKSNVGRLDKKKYRVQ